MVTPFQQDDACLSTLTISSVLPSVTTQMLWDKLEVKSGVQDNDGCSQLTCYYGKRPAFSTVPTG